MSRCQFDHATVIHQAMEAFWQQGYHATSMQTLFTATGIKAGSLYMAFGNKAGLFEKALAHYGQQSRDQLHQWVREAASPQAGIVRFLTALAQEGDSRGCLLVNSLLELSEVEPALSHLARNELAQMESCLAGYLDTDTQAQLVMLHILGIRGLRHLHAPAQQLTLLKASLPWLPWP